MILIGQAQYVELDPEEGIRSLLLEAKKKDFEIFHTAYLSIGIDEAHFLRDLLNRTSTAPDGRLVLVGISKATLDAQNALLKILEDLPARNTFVLVTPFISSFIPTLRSRLAKISVTGKTKESIDTAKFLTFGVAERLAMLKSYLVHIEDKEEKWGRMDEVREFLSNLERVLYARRVFYEKPQLATIIYTFKKELRGVAPSVRLMLEHLSFFVPTKN